ncbi:hypothetical protein KP509_20G005000 [Ceratopteris richardii]|uniref:Uncharacterized protein n=1 Tax=Ceratopteris richardii TaxID=49495 RepID=A0A8T2SFW4_CERRI|nr:hypothetical protein KP509_20G005000 [Ceratopteris richardii]
MAIHSEDYFLVLLIVGFVIHEAGAMQGRTTELEGKATVMTCGEEDIVVEQRKLSGGLHPRWEVVVRSKCAACKTSMVELWCPGWKPTREKEGFMAPVEMVQPGLCLLGAPISANRPFSIFYRQRAAPVNFSVASVRFSCGQ